MDDAEAVADEWGCDARPVECGRRVNDAVRVCERWWRECEPVGRAWPEEKPGKPGKRGRPVGKPDSKTREEPVGSKTRGEPVGKG